MIQTRINLYSPEYFTEGDKNPVLNKYTENKINTNIESREKERDTLVSHMI